MKFHAIAVLGLAVGLLIPGPVRADQDASAMTLPSDDKEKKQGRPGGSAHFWQERPAPKPVIIEPWDTRFRFGAYLWMNELDAVLSVEAVRATGTVDLGDALGNFDYGGAGFINLWYTDWRWDLTYHYVNLSDDFESPTGLSVEAEVQASILQLTGAFRFAHGPVGDVIDWSESKRFQPEYSFELMAGLRYANIRVDLDPAGLADATKTADWVDPIVGLRVHLDLVDDFSVSLSGDVGGFSLSSEMTWGLDAVIEFHPLPELSILAGFRLIDYDYGVGGFSFDGQIRGPYVGISSRF